MWNTLEPIATTDVAGVPNTNSSSIVRSLQCELTNTEIKKLAKLKHTKSLQINKKHQVAGTGLVLIFRLNIVQTYLGGSDRPN